MERKHRILVVDDEEDICEILQYNLQQAGYDVDTATHAAEALYKLKDNYDLILLDIMMDGISGLKMASLLREEYGNGIPIIFISALDTESDILKGFDSGGDDYISKPFSIKEVIARVKAVLARYHNHPDSFLRPAAAPVQPVPPAPPAAITCGHLKIEPDTKRAFVGGKEVLLTKKEFEILVLLVKSEHKILSREDILQKVWDNESYVLDRTVDVHIARLRKKLGVCGEMIVNRSGYGYCFQK